MGIVRVAPRAAIERLRAAVESWEGVTTHDDRINCTLRTDAHKDDDASSLYRAERTTRRCTLVFVRNVVRARQERINGGAPRPVRIHGHFEVERLPEHVHHDVQVGSAAES